VDSAGVLAGEIVTGLPGGAMQRAHVRDKIVERIYIVYIMTGTNRPTGYGVVSVKVQCRGSSGSQNTPASHGKCYTVFSLADASLI
jgi:hypothetical protein